MNIGTPITLVVTALSSYTGSQNMTSEEVPLTPVCVVVLAYTGGPWRSPPPLILVVRGKCFLTLLVNGEVIPYVNDQCSIPIHLDSV